MRSVRDLDDLMLKLKGLVLVREFRERRGADEVELCMYGAEIDRVREELAQLVRNGAVA
jgi:predicted SpoU family rRNA methylase